MHKLVALILMTMLTLAACGDDDSSMSDEDAGHTHKADSGEPGSSDDGGATADDAGDVGDAG